MRIVVTGGAGFIGSHLCERLLADRHEVICVDNYASGSKKNVSKLLGDARFELIRHDVVHYIDIECDQIYNLACPPLPGSQHHDPVRTVHVSVFGVTNMLELARRTGARVLHASTSEVYGTPEVHPQPEFYHGSVDPVGERACHEEGKRVAETLLMDYHRRHGVDVRVARIFDTYGPRMSLRDAGTVSSLVVRALLGEPLTALGDGEQPYSLCYVSDMVDGLITLMNEEGVTGPVNLGGTEGVSSRELAQMVVEMTGSLSVIERTVDGHPDPGEARVRCRPDITVARLLLGWSPRVSLRQGLVPTIEYARRTLAATGRVGASSGDVGRTLRSFAAPFSIAAPGNGNGRRNGKVRRGVRRAKREGVSARRRRTLEVNGEPRRRSRVRNMRRRT